MKIFIKIFCFFIIASVFSCTKVENPDLITLPQKDFFPEGITADKEGNLYVGSLKNGTILKINPANQKIKEFSKAEGKIISAIGLFVHENNLWACSSDTGASEFSGKGEISLKKIDLKTAEILKSYKLPDGGFCNDMTFDDKGNIYVTDSLNPRILTIDKAKDELVNFVKNKEFLGEGFNLNGIDFDGNKNLYVVKYNDGKLYKIDIEKKSIAKIHLPRPLFAADGLKYVNGNLFVIEGASKNDRALATAGNGQVTKIILGKNNSAILETVVEGLDVPTTFAVVGNEIWVVESQYDHLFKYKKIAPAPFLIRKIKIN